MLTEENMIEITDADLEELMNDDALIDDFAFQYRMHLMQQQQLENLKEQLD